MMRILVMSDSHQRKSLVTKIAEMHKEADLLIHCGDGEDDLDDVKLLYPKLKIVQVEGNCDWGSSLKLTEIVNIAGKKIVVAHGHKYGVKFGYEQYTDFAKSIDADICLFGHTHIPYSSYDNGLYIMNPGSVTDGNYGLIDITSGGIACNNATI